MTQEENVQVALRAFEVWLAGDVEGTLKLLDEEIEVYVPPELANTGTFRGHEQFLGWIQQWDEAWDQYEMEVGEVVPLGERHVVSAVSQRARGAGSGVPVEMDLAWLSEVRDGKVVALHLYSTPEDARRVGEERERSA